MGNYEINKCISRLQLYLVNKMLNTDKYEFSLFNNYKYP